MVQRIVSVVTHLQRMARFEQKLHRPVPVVHHSEVQGRVPKEVAHAHLSALLDRQLQDLRIVLRGDHQWAVAQAVAGIDVRTILEQHLKRINVTMTDRMMHGSHPLCGDLRRPVPELLAIHGGLAVKQGAHGKGVAEHRRVHQRKNAVNTGHRRLQVEVVEEGHQRLGGAEIARERRSVAPICRQALEQGEAVRHELPILVQCIFLQQAHELDLQHRLGSRRKTRPVALMGELAATDWIKQAVLGADLEHGVRMPHEEHRRAVPAGRQHPRQSLEAAPTPCLPRTVVDRGAILVLNGRREHNEEAASLDVRR
mmetsp:Transcript_112909/g.326146  ORF Transcript_112909/g.326146 Transcript_112909/m.326146 type:complete len:312 (-) Transcript_112909:532-1467(-)